MISNQEKRERLNTILELLSDNQNSDETSHALHQLLMDDCQGRLYKYMPIRDYTVPAIRDKTLYFSSPKKFNDPFDCKVGIDIHSIIEAFYLKEFDHLEEYFSEFVAVVDGVKPLNSITPEKMPIIMQWLGNERLIQFLTAAKGQEKTDEEINEVMLNNFDIVTEIMKPLLSDVASKKKMPVTDSMFIKILENMTEDGKLRLLESNGTYADYIKSFGVDDVDADEITLTEKAYETIHPEEMDSVHRASATFADIERRLNDSLYELFKVCCLCTTNKNRLMWSHYADSHKGICIEYDFSECLRTDCQPMPVYYSDARPKFPWQVAIEQTQEVQREATIHFINALLTKDEAWSYEKEWRLLIKAEPNVDKIPAPPIKCIYLGALCPDEQAEEIIKAAQEICVPVKRMTVDRGEYELHSAEICNPAKE